MERQTIKLEGETICTWILRHPGRLVGWMNYDKAAAFVKSIADQFDTAGKTKGVPYDNRKRFESDGPYGWQIDQGGRDHR